MRRVTAGSCPPDGDTEPRLRLSRNPSHTCMSNCRATRRKVQHTNSSNNCPKARTRTLDIQHSQVTRLTIHQINRRPYADDVLQANIPISRRLAHSPPSLFMFKTSWSPAGVETRELLSMAPYFSCVAARASFLRRSCMNAAAIFSGGTHTSRTVAVPVVLVRLKRKNEEWRCPQREWSHTWRQVDVRNV